MYLYNRPSTPEGTGENGAVRFRRSIGVGLAALTIAVTLIFAAGLWNPWHLVILAGYFGNPVAGVVWILAGVLVSVWLLRPVTSEAAQHGRIMLRFGIGAMLALS